MSSPVSNEAFKSILPPASTTQRLCSEPALKSVEWPEPPLDVHDTLPLPLPGNTSDGLSCIAEPHSTITEQDSYISREVTCSDPSPVTTPEQVSTSVDASYTIQDVEDAIETGIDNYSDENESDSAIGSSFVSDTVSLNSSITAYRVENGRRYHAYKDGAYWVPNDERQNEQQDIGHHLYTLILDGRLFLAPILPHPQKVLDLGTGTGIWAIDVADKYPSAIVIGTDLSPTQPQWVPPNVHFEIEDFNDEWTFRENEFDFIHMRNIYGSVVDWGHFYEQAYKHLKPGAWIEQYELSVTFKSDDGSVKTDSEMELLNRIAIEAGIRIGKSTTISEDMYQLISSAGFVAVTQKEFKAPHSGWHVDPKWKEIGIWGQLELEVGLEGFGMALLTRVFGWTVAEVHVHHSRIRAELRNPNIHSYHYVRVVYAQKPYES